MPDYDMGTIGEVDGADDILGALEDEIIGEVDGIYDDIAAVGARGRLTRRDVEKIVEERLRRAKKRAKARTHKSIGQKGRGGMRICGTYTVKNQAASPLKDTLVIPVESAMTVKGFLLYAGTTDITIREFRIGSGDSLLANLGTGKLTDSASTSDALADQSAGLRLVAGSAEGVWIPWSGTLEQSTTLKFSFILNSSVDNATGDLIVQAVGANVQVPVLQVI